KKGDSVIITAGNDKGVVGEILAVNTKQDRVLVQGVNVRSKHIKPSQANPQGGIIQKEMPVHMSNVSPVVDGKPSRVRFETKADGSKVRVAVRNGNELHTLHGPKSKKTETK
ncbi:MAG: 50S ribosomal protein L24, partial [Planctomycetota bacterium]|nr:50S ribosomal protein L24 [Planctomycetota bacterium]